MVVCRTAYKNNSSRYTINDKNSSFTEVTTLLKARGIDLEHKRFLILQGEVESIAQMKPKAQTEHDEGLLEYLEDIIGTSGYKEPIEDAFADLEKLAEERSEKLNRLRIVEREKQALEERKKEADNYLKDQNEYARALSRRFQWVIWDSGNKLENANETIVSVFEGDYRNLINVVSIANARATTAGRDPGECKVCRADSGSPG